MHPGVDSRFWQLVVNFVIGVLRAVMTYAGMFIIDRWEPQQRGGSRPPDVSGMYTRM